MVEEGRGWDGVYNTIHPRSCRRPLECIQVDLGVGRPSYCLPHAPSYSSTIIPSLIPKASGLSAFASLQLRYILRGLFGMSLYAAFAFC